MTTLQSLEYPDIMNESDAYITLKYIRFLWENKTI